MGVRLLLTANGCGTKRKKDTTMKISRIKELKNFCLAAAIFVAGASLTSCSSSDDIAENNQQPVENPTAPKVYTMTIQASKGDGATTRALTLSGSTLNATWATTENVYVQKGSDWADGSLQPQAGGTTATLKGKLSKVAINPNDELTLQFPRSGAIDYTGQVGTLDNIAANYDYATASVTVASVNDGNITAKDDANFVNQQAIIKFTLLDDGNSGAPINPSAFTITDGTSTVELTGLSSSTNVLYVAFPAAGSAKTVTLTATDGDNTYIYSKSGVTFTNGQYYEITVKMYKRNVNLGSLKTNFTARDGQVLSGTLNDNYKISIAADATVTLDGVTINGVNNSSYNWAGLTCLGNATIVLADGKTNTVKGFDYNYPGIQVGPEGSTLTIDGTGSLNASSNTESQFGEGCPGIGSGWEGTCGDITIVGGTITAKGGTYAAGIGSGNKGTCGTITIKGGTITAMCGFINGNGDFVAYTGGAGIGSCGGTCGDITIVGGTITAKGGVNAAGIGSGWEGECGAITIASTVSRVTATKGDTAPNSIGAGEGGSCGTVAIGGTEYWGKNDHDQYIYKNSGDSYLKQSTLVYPPVQ